MINLFDFKIICTQLNIDTRITVLGHVQRGGNASAYDRILGARMGSEAVIALMKAKPHSKAQVVAVNGNKTALVNLIDAVEKTQQVALAIKEKAFHRATELRGFTFQRNLQTFIHLSKLEPKLLNQKSEYDYTLAIMNIGAPACGANSAVRSFVRHGATRYSKIKILGIRDGFAGLLEDHVVELNWKSVNGWTAVGGSNLGCQRTIASQVGFEKIAKKLKQNGINGILIIGGFEAYMTVIELYEQRSNFKEFCIPLVCIPATISSNVPGSDLSIGTDTALNEIVSICDKLKLSAMGSKRRVFLVETMGGYCGLLASLSALASGADHSFIHEEPFNIHDLTDEIEHMKKKMQGDLKRGIIIRNEFANPNYTSQFIESLMVEEGKGVFSARMNILGHMQQGGVPSPFDRNLGIKFGGRSLKYMADLLDKTPEHILSNDKSAVVIGIVSNKIEFTSVKYLKQNNTDFVHRKPLRQWWMKLRPLARILGKHEAVYTSDIEHKPITEEECDDKEFELLTI